MTIYSLQAEKVESSAKPVKTPRKRKPKTENNETKLLESIEPVDINTPPAKKPRTEKQIAAAEKMRASRLAKKEMALKEAAEAEEAIKNEIANKEKELADKKAAAKARRDEKKAEKMHEKENGKENEVKKNELPPKKKGVKFEPPTPATNEEEPPLWFKKFHQNIRQEIAQEKNEAISKKAVNNQAKALAVQKWNDPPTRAKVQHEMDSHQARMYSMMFSKPLQ